MWFDLILYLKGKIIFPNNPRIQKMFAPLSLQPDPQQPPDKAGCNTGEKVWSNVQTSFHS